MVHAVSVALLVCFAHLLPTVESFAKLLSSSSSSVSISSRSHLYRNIILDRPTVVLQQEEKRATKSSFAALSMTTVAPDDDDALLEQILAVAMDASQKAGDIILGNAGGAEVTERKANSRDLLTLIDPLCEKVGLVDGGGWREL